MQRVGRRHRRPAAALLVLLLDLRCCDRVSTSTPCYCIWQLLFVYCSETSSLYVISRYQLIANAPTTSYDGALLPWGGGNASLITGIAYVADQLGAASRAIDVVVCGPMVVSVSDLANLTSRLLAASFESGNVEGVFQAMVASSSVLNAPNCSLEGGSDLTCGALNRENCAVENTCADCLDGYVGLAGPSNAPCSVEAASCSNGARDAESESDVDCGGSCAPCEATGANCTLDADCTYSWCRSGACAVPVKPCVNNCTGHGRCEYTDTTGARLPARECTADLWSCTASCACNEGWCVVEHLLCRELGCVRGGQARPLRAPCPQPPSTGVCWVSAQAGQPLQAPCVFSFSHDDAACKTLWRSWPVCRWRHSRRYGISK